MNPLDLTGRTIVVTGASSGIGRATAILLAELGAKLVLVARREDELHKTVALLNGSEHIAAVFDLRNFVDIDAWLKSIAQKTGEIHGIVHSAGLAMLKPLRFVQENDLEQLFSINVNAAMGLAKALRQPGVHAQNASLVLLASVAGIVGQAGLSVYSATKGAVIALTKSLAAELARSGIRVNCVAPAIVQTDMIDKSHSALTVEQQQELLQRCPLGLGTAHDVACAIAFLLADTSRWITGTTLVVDGGFSTC